MRKFAILLALVALTSCAVTRDRIVETRFLDFRPYAQDGFFISPDPYPGEFDALGEILVTIHPAIVPKTKVAGGKFNDGVYSSGQYVTEQVPGSELVEAAVRAALEFGADGIADFKCTAVYLYQSEGKTVADHYEVSGLAIKRR